MESWSWWRTSYELTFADRHTNNAVKRVIPSEDVMKYLLEGTELPQYQFIHKSIANSDIEQDETGYRGPLKQHKALGRTQIPILLLSGWQDVFVRQNLDDFEQLKANGCNVELTVGP